MPPPNSPYPSHKIVCYRTNARESWRHKEELQPATFLDPRHLWPCSIQEPLQALIPVPSRASRSAPPSPRATHGLQVPGGPRDPCQGLPRRAMLRQGLPGAAHGLLVLGGSGDLCRGLPWCAVLRQGLPRRAVLRQGLPATPGTFAEASRGLLHFAKAFRSAPPVGSSVDPDLWLLGGACSPIPRQPLPNSPCPCTGHEIHSVSFLSDLHSIAGYPGTARESQTLPKII